MVRRTLKDTSGSISTRVDFEGEFNPRQEYGAYRIDFKPGASKAKIKQRLVDDDGSASISDIGETSVNNSLHELFGEGASRIYVQGYMKDRTLVIIATDEGQRW